jgi:hypothetical protein
VHQAFGGEPVDSSFGWSGVLCRSKAGGDGGKVVDESFGHPTARDEQRLAPSPWGHYRHRHRHALPHRGLMMTAVFAVSGLAIRPLTVIAVTASLTRIGFCLTTIRHANRLRNP